MEAEEFLSIVNTKIKDKALREYIFKRELLPKWTTRDRIVSACHNVLRLAFAVVYCKFDDLHKLSINADAKTRISFENLRVSEALLATFTTDEASLEMVAYVLTEILVNNARESDYGFLFRSIDPITRVPYDPALFDSLLKTIRNFEKFSGDTPEKIDCMMEMFITLISVMRFFDEAKLNISEDGLFTLSFVDRDLGNLEYHLWFELDNNKIPLLIYNNENDKYYFLSSMQDRLDKSYLGYVNLANHNEMHCEEISKASVESKKTKQREISFLRKLFTENYKNLKESAFIIIDAIGNDSNALGRIIKNYNCEDKSQDFFIVCRREGVDENDVSNKECDLYNWDNLITMLLAQYGPSDFLDTVLGMGTAIDHTLFQNILDKIEKRYNSKITKEKWFIQANEEIKKQNNRMPLHIPQIEREIYIKENTIFVYRRIIISALRSLLGEEHQSSGERGKGIRLSAQVKHKSVIGIINDIVYGGKKPISESLNSVKNDLKETLKLLIMFYEGIVAYGEKVCEQERNLLKSTGESGKDRSGQRMMAAERRAEAIIREAERVEAFCVTAKNALSRLRGRTLCEINQFFKDLCSKFTFVPKDNEGHLVKTSIVRTDMSGYLYKMINRHQILEPEEYDLVTSIPRDSVSQNFPQTITNIFEYLDSPRLDYSDAAFKQDAISVLTRIKNFYVYLVFASDYKDNGVIPQEKDIDPIFPYHIRYHSKEIDKDRYNKNTFLIRSSMGDLTGDGHFLTARDCEYDKIKILTDKNYDEHEHFYAIPRREGSTPSWWITPFMIPASSVNALMNDTEENTNATPNA